MQRTNRWGRAARAVGGVAAAVVVAQVLTGAAADHPLPAAAQEQAAPPTTVRLAAAGDIACEPGAPVGRATCQHGAVAGLIDRLGADWVLPLGDTQYPDGSLDGYLRSYGTTWGRFAARTLPALGNHEYQTPGASGYFAYWQRTGADPDQDGQVGVRSWYTRSVGAGWLVVSLDSDCEASRNCDAGTTQYQFLERTLAALPDNPCVVASMHHPRFTAGDHGNEVPVAPLFDLLAAKHVPLVLSGHNHHYERLLPAGPSGRADAPAPGRTIQIVAGTGGKSLDASVTPAPFDAKVVDGTFGVVSVEAGYGRANATFVDLAGETRDSVAVSCTPVSSPASKTPIFGFVDRQGQISDPWAGVIRGIVVDVGWNQLQPRPDGPLATANPIDQALATAKAFNTRHPDSPIAVKLRVRTGISAPDWLKQRTGTVRLAGSEDTYRWWTPPARAAYDALMAQLASRYDTNPLVREVAVSRCTSTFAEPFSRPASELAALRAGGLTAAEDAECHREQIEAHRVWANTYSALALTPYDDPDTATTGTAFTTEMMRYCRAQLGDHCLLEGHSARDSTVDRGLTELFDAMRALGTPLSMQTAPPGEVGDLGIAVTSALEVGAGSVELPGTYRDGGPVTFRRRFAAAIAEMARREAGSRAPAPAGSPKMPIFGFVDRQGQISDPWAGVIRGIVVDVGWNQLQPRPDGPLATANPIDQALATAEAFNTRHPDSPIALKLRVRTGIYAPDWLKQRTGTVRVSETISGIAGDTYRWWTPPARAAYDALMAQLASRYDANPLVREVQVSRCSAVFSEPFLRYRGGASFEALRGAGLTTATDLACHREELEAHLVWVQTYSALALNPYDNPDTSTADTAFTVRMMEYCRQLLGGRCLLENHSLREATHGPAYEQLYRAMQAMGAPLSIQTMTPDKVGDITVVVARALDLGAWSVELPRSYRDIAPPAFRSRFTAAIAEMDRLEALSTPPGPHPPLGAIPPPTGVTLDARDTAQAYLFGSIWSDGFEVAGGIAAFHTSSARIAASIEAAARTAGWRYERFSGPGGAQIRFPDVPFASVNYHGTMPGFALDGEGRRLTAFLVGVIQSEGDRTSGLVLDDPYRDRAEAMSTMLSRLGLRHTVRGTGYFEVLADRSAWPVFATWPFVDWSRVPGAP